MNTPDAQINPAEKIGNCESCGCEIVVTGRYKRDLVLPRLCEGCEREEREDDDEG